jgi:heat shock protein HslJ
LRRLLFALAIVTLGLAAAACSSSPGAGGTIDGTSWRLTVQDVEGTETPVPAGVVVTAVFADGQVTGSAGCNTYNASFTASGSNLTFGTAATTAMACDPAVNAFEQEYLANLDAAASYTATADALTIYESGGKQLLAYEAAPADPLLGEWNVTGYNNGAEAVISPIAGTTLTATFMPDGTVSGNAGCNTFNGPYTLDGTSLTVGPLATTMKACEQDVMDQETQFLTALQTPTNVETSGATVTLRAESGATQVVLAPS